MEGRYTLRMEEWWSRIKLRACRILALSTLPPSLQFAVPFLVALAFSVQSPAFAFEGRIQAVLTRGGETQTWLYTVGTNCLRIERAETNWPHAKNIIALDTGTVTLVFPHNRSFVRLKDSGAHAPARVSTDASSGGIGHETRLTAPGAGAFPTLPAMHASSPTNGPTNLPDRPDMPKIPAMPQIPPGIGPQPVGAPNVGSMPLMPMMPMDMMEKLELKATGQKTNLLGYTCEKFELQQRGEVMEIWATDKLLPFQPWRPNQPPRFGPRMLEEQWGEMLKTKKLFPLLAILKFENGPERLRFEVRAIKAEKIVDPDGLLFQPPADYHEIEPLLF